MPRQVPRIEIPHTDIWTVLFEREDKPFPDSQVIYQCPTTGRNYTYASLKRTTELFGTGLRSHWKWQKGDVLALFAQNCIDTPAVTWGCHWAGGVVSPANPAYTARELGHHLRDSGARALFTQKNLLGTALKAASEAGMPRERIVLIGDDRDRGVRHVTEILGERLEGSRTKLDPGSDLAFLVYSSGTTGLPKGVMLTHLNVVSNLFMVNSSEGALLQWNKDKILSVLPYYHIYGLQCLVHLPAYAGLTTIVMSSFDLKNFCAIIQDNHITYTYVAPPIILHLAKSPIISNYDLSSLRMITSGAAPLAKDLIHAVKNRLGTEVKQAYGLSETSPVTHIQKAWNHGMGSNGPALPNQVVKFMSPDGQEVPTGKEGELWIKGPNVFLGYLNNIEATKACKTEDGFFKTGDIGYEDEDGNMYITDRVKELIKYKGFQVAPAELEGILASHELVNDVAVIGIQDHSQATEVPLAFVAPKEGVERSEANGKLIVDWLAERVAGHKRLRGGVRWIDEVPKSASGKIPRRILKDLLAKEGGVVKAKL
ncbi:putative 4-coumarate-ligase 1 [Hyphodiscus hymeniophilus]|uniref:4-coumarate-ligase 1 n=1 Tax=Hyphodiscus hymeniophilus TaxID=353542 RepID=A0A9P6VFP3_9HELO|nr:putative 4-coumarate-ligase 1 [Hyphodiscus hymeniophilus]